MLLHTDFNNVVLKCFKGIDFLKYHCLAKNFFYTQSTKNAFMILFIFVHIVQKLFGMS